MSRHKRTWLTHSELSDDDNDDDDDENDENEVEPAENYDKLTAVQKEERMRNLVAPLSELEWGRKTQKEPESDIITIGGPEPKAPGKVAQPEPPQMRSSVFSKLEYDGVESDSDDEMDESELPAPGTLGRRIAEMRWGDMGPQIEEIDDEEEEKSTRKKKLELGDDIDEKMRAKVWGAEEADVGEEAPVVVGVEEDVDMGEEEAEFIRFSKEALGIDEDTWAGILSSRKDRGGEWPACCENEAETPAFVPNPPKEQEEGKTPNGLRSAQHLPHEKNPAPTHTSTASAEVQAEAPRADGQPNPALDSFDSVMAAMDAELARIKGPSAVASMSPPSASSTEAKTAPPKPAPLPKLPTEDELDDLDEETLAAMDRELKAALKQAGVEDSDDEEDIEEAAQLDADGKREYEMMKSFLESYRSQGGQSGVVGNLFGRLGQGEKR